MLSKGFTLAELMVGIALGLLVVLGSLFGLKYTLGGSSALSINTQMDADMQAAMTLLTRELRRAGYWGQAAAAVGVDPNLYKNPFADISSSGTCIRFSYDFNGNGALDVLPAFDERRAFALQDRMLWYRKGGDFGCSPNSAGWEPLFDPGIVLVDGFRIEEQDTAIPVNGATRSIHLRSYLVTLDASSRTDATIRRQLKTNIKVRNDAFY
jgi:prepilin peptidase dependent protein B